MNVTTSVLVEWLINELFRLAVCQNEFCQTLRGLAFDVGEGRHAHAALLNLLDNGILICHRAAQRHDATGFRFMALGAICIEYVFSAGSLGRRVVIGL